MSNKIKAYIMYKICYSIHFIFLPLNSAKLTNYAVVIRFFTHTVLYEQ